MVWLLKFASSRLGIGVIVGLGALLAIGAVVMLKNAEIRSQGRTIAAQQTRIEQLASDLTQCRANNAELDRGRIAQNAAVEAMRREGEARVAELDRVAVRASQAARTAQERAARILARRPGADQCADAAALIAETVR